MDARRRRQARRRPVVLFAALLAPAIFAAGLLAGESGRDDQTGSRRAVAVGERAMRFGPVAVPAPAHPVRAFAAPVPPRVTAPPVVEEPVVVTPVVAPRTREPEDTKTREPEDTRRGTPTAEKVCPGEWEDTWLWELCREHERKLAAGP